MCSVFHNKHLLVRSVYFVKIFLCKAKVRLIIPISVYIIKWHLSVLPSNENFSNSFEPKNSKYTL